MQPAQAACQAICDYVHECIGFNYQNARSTRTAAQAFEDRTGVCRDYAYLAVAFCRCMNIPARSRILVARGRDASNVAIVTSFGPNYLASFRVWAHEVAQPADL